ncbi:MAG: hypothetical protein LBP75_10810 [Planctomycetota bacterium]|jgi:hypothetical protein|nr:hypothetical protein [Planctomycetota bacterium]
MPTVLKQKNVAPLLERDVTKAVAEMRRSISPALQIFVTDKPILSPKASAELRSDLDWLHSLGNDDKETQWK